MCMVVGWSSVFWMIIRKMTLCWKAPQMCCYNLLARPCIPSALYSCQEVVRHKDFVATIVRVRHSSGLVADLSNQVQVQRCCAYRLVLDFSGRWWGFLLFTELFSGHFGLMGEDRVTSVVCGHGWWCACHGSLRRPMTKPHRTWQLSEMLIAVRT